MSGRHAFGCCARTSTITCRTGQLFAPTRRPANAIRCFSLPDWVSLTRTVFHFLARANPFSCGRSSSICAATVNLAHGICNRQIQEHKSEGWQDRLPPVLGAMCNALLLDRDLSNLPLINKRWCVDQNPGAYSGNVIDHINVNMANCVRSRQNRPPSAAELRGRNIVTVPPCADCA
jgi:hypothetical protein